MNWRSSACKPIPPRLATPSLPSTVPLSRVPPELGKRQYESYSSSESGAMCASFNANLHVACCHVSLMLHEAPPSMLPGRPQDQAPAKPSYGMGRNRWHGTMEATAHARLGKSATTRLLLPLLAAIPSPARNHSPGATTDHDLDCESAHIAVM